MNKLITSSSTDGQIDDPIEKFVGITDINKSLDKLKFKICNNNLLPEPGGGNPDHETTDNFRKPLTNLYIVMFQIILYVMHKILRSSAVFYTSKCQEKISTYFLTKLMKLSDFICEVIVSPGNDLSDCSSSSIYCHYLPTKSSCSSTSFSSNVSVSSHSILKILFLTLLIGNASSFGIREPPRRTVPHDSEVLTVPPQDSLTLSCPIVGTPRPIFEWSKDGESVTEGTWDHIAVSRNTLRITNIHLDDTGRYVCTAVNGFGRQNYTFTIRINDPLAPPTLHGDSEPPTMVQVSPASGSLVSKTVGHSVRFKCEVQGRPEPQVRWLKDGALVPSSWSVVRSDGHHSLVLSKLTTQHAGLYTCAAVNDYGIAAVNWTLHVMEGSSNSMGAMVPTLSLSGSNSSVSLGEHRAVLSCSGRTTGEVRGQWLRQVTPFSSTNLSSSSPPGEVLSWEGRQYQVLQLTNLITTPTGVFVMELAIVNPRTEDAGQYVCTASTPAGFVYGHATLAVLPRGPGHVLLFVMGGLGAIAVVAFVTAIIATYRRRQRSKNRSRPATINGASQNYKSSASQSSSQASTTLLPSNEAKMQLLMSGNNSTSVGQKVFHHGTPNGPPPPPNHFSGQSYVSSGPGCGVQHSRYVKHPGMQQGRVGDSTMHLAAATTAGSEGNPHCDRYPDVCGASMYHNPGQTQLSPNGPQHNNSSNITSGGCGGASVSSPQGEYQHFQHPLPPPSQFPATSCPQQTSPHPPPSFQYHQLDVI